MAAVQPRNFVDARSDQLLSAHREHAPPKPLVYDGADQLPELRRWERRLEILHGPFSLYQAGRQEA